MAYAMSQDVDPITFAEAQGAGRGSAAIPGAAVHGTRTPSRHGSPSPFSRSPSSRGGSVPPGTPVNTMSRLCALLFALEQGEEGSEPDQYNHSHQDFASISTTSSATINWAKAAVR